ncbi:putative rRNA processing protein Utp6 [Talaromyces proteolyticus]|uniref:rRNA processing protein Utp6 n=1 Tax=Talaromyces proteolyticus TaxID=1131652 RepID=A0AAD4KJR1_9EURO|nr:putative rRNA processing protein Utp6 [Talaromyces proteolyticus]KAH8693035.1 putative rRNA processing protein Utp6 [Talaromyces proteolyticus]
MAADKARFYLEKAVPELKEYEKKGIFSKDEIRSIAKKRSDFEHKVNASGVSPSDFARYAEYEMNLETLRKKRTKRLGVKAAAQHTGRRTLFILDRATRKCPGDLGLWVQYIEFCRQQKMYRRLSDVFADALRLHPSKAELWIYAAKYTLEEHADMTQARSYFQRGLRFCKTQRNMWVQYGKLECIYIAKLSARRRILGLDQPPQEKSALTEAVDEDADMMALPKITAEDINPELGKEDGVDEGALKTLDATPALTGAIPMAIFDAAMKQSANNPILAHEFFDMIFEFEDLPCLRKIVDHVVAQQLSTSPNTYHTAICHIKSPVAGIRVTSPEFPRAFGTSLSHMKKYQMGFDLAQELTGWLKVLSENKELDPSLQKAVMMTIGRVQRDLAPKHGSQD